jgi:hypothetical protein
MNQEELPEMNHLLERVHPRADRHQIVEELRGSCEVLEHELLVAQRVENVFGGEQPSLPVVDLQDIQEKSESLKLGGWEKNGTYVQGCGSGLDPDSIGSVDPDPEAESGRAKMTHKSRKNL